MLRHYPIEGAPGGGPRPLRTWQEPFGKEDLSEEERSKVEEDDLMMWRSIMLYIVTSEVRRALPQKFGKKDVKLGFGAACGPRRVQA